MTDRRVERFRSVDDMNRAPVRASEPADADRFFRQCARYWSASPRRYPRGVFKFRSIDEAEAARTSSQLRPAH